MTEQVQQRQAEVQALTRVAGAEFVQAVDGVEAIHRAISDRVFATIRLGVGPAATPVKIVHDAITDGVYAVIAGSGIAAGEIASAVTVPGDATPSRTPLGAGVLGVLQGLIGDSLEQQEPILAAPMTIRVDAEPVPPAQLAAHTPAPSSRLAVFVHGLAETEHAWHLGERPDYGTRLAEDLGYTPVYLRYNSGLHISENAEQLSALLEQLVRSWPIPVEEVALIGHSMGGLVIRSAGHHGVDNKCTWVSRVHRIVCLGSPQQGSPVARVAHYAAAALDTLPETRPLSSLLRRRSAGIRDLRDGSLVDADWRDTDADTLRARATAEVPLLPGAEHYFVTATLTRSAEHPLGRLLGDGLVLRSSGSAAPITERVNGWNLTAAHHFTLLNNNAVYSVLREWFSEPVRRASPQPARTT